MVKTRTYDKSRTSIECHVYEGNKLVMHLVYYNCFNYGYPRYHFENFCLQLRDLNYEIQRFMNFVHKCLLYPHIDVEALDSEDFDLHLGL